MRQSDDETADQESDWEIKIEGDNKEDDMALHCLLDSLLDFDPNEHVLSF